MTTRLGEFDVLTPIASGGMGTVWTAVHAGTQTRVAIKVLSNTDPLYVDAFRREVQAIARLRHPRIVDVYDYGIIPQGRESENLPSGAGWLAMELATQGSLANTRISSFRRVRAILLDILGALAYSHARKIIHRDIKPGNVLLVEEADSTRYKLSDFGIAHAKNESRSTREVFASSAGTPWYMPPEQIESRWREYGPPTDLYAIGCLAYELVSGRTPFVGAAAIDVIRQHLFEAPAPIDPRFSIPEGFEAWILRLLRKRPLDRFHRVADAMWELLQLDVPDAGEPQTLEIFEDIPVFGDFDTMPGDAFNQTPAFSPAGEPTLPMAPGVPRFKDVPTRPIEPRSLLGLPPISEDWRPATQKKRPAIRGAGLGLFGLRDPPFVGREIERTIIWETLRKTATAQTAHAVLVQGPSGAGKTRLVEWMSQRADELGAATVLTSTHGPAQEPGAGLRDAVEHHFGCVGLNRKRTAEQIRWALDSGDHGPSVVDAHTNRLVRWLRPADDQANTALVTRPEIFATLYGVLTLETQERPVVFMIDDGQWGVEALNFARYALKRHRKDQGLSLLFLITLRNDAADLGELGRSAISELADHPESTLIDLAPLDEQLQIDLVDGLLSLHPSTRTTLFERTKGNLLFSLHLLEDWVDTGCLEVNPDGYQLGTGTAIPKDFMELWLKRLRKAMNSDRDYEQGIQALETAAALGHDIETSEWGSLTELMGVSVPHAMMETLADRGLIRWSQRGWAFEHSAMRDSLIMSAKHHGRATRQHRAIALFLAATQNVVSTASRRARHLLAAGEVELAITPLLDAIQDHIDTERSKEARALAEQAEQAMLEAGIGESDERFATLLVKRMRIAAQFHQHNEIPHLARKLLDPIQDERWPALRSCALRLLALNGIRQEEYAEAAEISKQAAELARSANVPIEEAHAHRTTGWALLLMDQKDEARRAFLHSCDLYEAAGASGLSGPSLGALSEISRHEQDFVTARKFANQGLRVSLESGNREAEGEALTYLGNLALSEGDFVAAQRFLRRGIGILDSMGHSYAEDVRFQLATVLLHARDLNTVEPLLERLLVFFRNVGEHGRARHIELAQIALCAFRGDAEKWDSMFVESTEPYTSDRDLSKILESAGDEWAARNDEIRAYQAFDAAVRLASTTDSERGRLLKEKLDHNR